MKTQTEKVDTRNRYQRIFDAKYGTKLYQTQDKKQTINMAEFHELLMQKGNTNIDYYANLSKINAIETQTPNKHPRTREMIQFQTSNVQDYSKFPRVAYHRKKNQVFQKITATIQNDKLNVEIESEKPRKTNQWKTVWYSKHQRRK